mgnify:FL=1
MAVENKALNEEIERQKKLRASAKNIVEISKSQAAVDTGRLKRSISFVISLDGKFVFTEAFYGQFYDNSMLEENINPFWDKSEPYDLIYTDDNGDPFQTVRKYGSGRISVNRVPNTKAKKSILDTLRSYRDNVKKAGGIKSFIETVAAKKID